MTLARALVISLHYWPETTGNAPYSTGLAEHFAVRGFDVDVLAGMPHYPQWHVQQEYRGRLRVSEHRHGVTVQRLWHYVPRRQSALRRGVYELSFVAHAFALHRLPRPDLIIGVVPGLSGGILARVLAQRWSVPYGVLFQDLMGRAAHESGIAGGSRVAGVTASAERWMIGRAGAVAAVSRDFLPHLEALGANREQLVHVPNWTHINAPAGDRTATRAAMGWAATDRVVLHAGNMGLKQGLDQVIDAARLAQAGRSSLRFVLLGDGNQRRSLESMAAGLRSVNFLDPVSDALFPDVLAAADVLLVSERTEARSMSLPSKLTSYLAAARPILAAVSADGATAAEVARTGAGVVVSAGDPQALLDAAGQLVADTALGERLSAAAIAYMGEHLTPDRAFAQIDEFVGQIQGVRPDSREIGAVERVA